MAKDSSKNTRKEVAMPANLTNAIADVKRDALLQPVRNVKDLHDDLAAGEWIKKPDLCGMGSFNLVGATKRSNTFKGKTTEQIVFEVQFLDGDVRGSRALVSMENNIVREKYFNAVKKYGGVGPLVLTVQESESTDMNNAFVFADAVSDEAPASDGGFHDPG